MKRNVVRFTLGNPVRVADNRQIYLSVYMMSQELSNIRRAAQPGWMRVASCISIASRS